MEKLTIKVPYEERTLVHKNNDGFRIGIKGVDVLDYQIWKDDDSMDDGAYIQKPAFSLLSQ